MRVEKLQMLVLQSCKQPVCVFWQQDTPKAFRWDCFGTCVIPHGWCREHVLTRRELSAEKGQYHGLDGPAGTQMMPPSL